MRSHSVLRAFVSSRTSARSATEETVPGRLVLRSAFAEVSRLVSSLFAKVVCSRFRRQGSGDASAMWFGSTAHCGMAPMPSSLRQRSGPGAAASMATSANRRRLKRPEGDLWGDLGADAGTGLCALGPGARHRGRFPGLAVRNRPRRLVPDSVPRRFATLAQWEVGHGLASLSDGGSSVLLISRFRVRFTGGALRDNFTPCLRLRPLIRGV
jgi:hypothetical protein